MIHIQRFIDRVEGTDARGLRDFTMSMTDAKALHADITRLLLDLNNLRTQQLSAINNTPETVTVEVQGGSF